MGCSCLRDTKDSLNPSPDSKPDPNSSPPPNKSKEIPTQTSQESVSFPLTLPLKVREIRRSRLEKYYELGMDREGLLVKGKLRQSEKQCWVRMCEDSQDAERSKRIAAIRALDHPNILKIIDAVKEKDQLYLVYEDTCGGSAASLLASRYEYGKRPGLSEPLTTHIMQQVMSALSYCHSQGLVFASLSLKNLLFTEEPREAQVCVKLVFPLEEDIEMETSCMAPELLNKKYAGPENDVYSCGALMSSLLIGDSLVAQKQTTTPSTTFKSVYARWETVSKPLRQLTALMLTRSHTRRITLEQCRTQLCEQKRVDLKPHVRNVLKHIASCKPLDSFQRVILRLIVDLIVSEKELKTGQEAFRDLDVCGDGYIRESDLQTQVYRLFPITQAESALAAITACVNFTSDRTLAYSEFLLLSFSRSSLLSKSHLKSLHKLLTTDDTAKITSRELGGWVSVEGEETEGLKTVLNGIGGKDGKVSFEQMCRYLHIEA